MCLGNRLNSSIKCPPILSRTGLVPSVSALLRIQPVCRQVIECESQQMLQVLGNQSDFLRSLYLTGLAAALAELKLVGYLGAGGGFRSGFWLVLPAVHQLWCSHG